MSLNAYRFVVLFYLFTVVLAVPSKFLNAAENVEILKHLNHVNKPPVKSIQSPDGDIIDCVHIFQQPAFDNPILKDHNIKLKPDYHPNWMKDDNNKVSSISQLWHANGKCPEETIPIRRTKMDDILRASSVKSYAKKTGVVAQNGRKREQAIVQTSGQFFGAKATMNVWNPNVEEADEHSLGQLWILGGSGSDLNTIEAGWHVLPSLYNDTNTRLFIYWTRNGYNGTGCYNLNCAGFVQTNNDIALGSTISTSQLDGSQEDITIRVSKNPIDGRWWIHVGDKALGYWPPKLFSNLESASEIHWGGEVINDQLNGHHTTTQMGSGHFPKQGEGEKKVSYFKNIQIYDERATFTTPEGLHTHASKSNCYDIKLGADEDWGSFFYYGGPGRNEHCP